MAVSNTKMKRTDVDRRRAGSASPSDYSTQPALLHPVTAQTDLTVANNFKASECTPGDLVPVFNNGRVSYYIWNEADDDFQHFLQSGGCPERYELKWVAGALGTPGINGDLASGVEATRVPADRVMEVTGTNATSALCTVYAEGGITLTTGTTANDQMILTPHLDTEQTGWSTVTWGTDNEVWYEADITTDSTITGGIYWAGLKLTNTSTSATDDDQVFFRYQSTQNSGKWEVVSEINNGTIDEHDSGVTVAVDTRYHLAIKFDAAGVAKCYIDGVLVETCGSFTGAHADLIPYVGVQTTDTTASVLNVHGQAISRAIG